MYARKHIMIITNLFFLRQQLKFIRRCNITSQFGFIYNYLLLKSLPASYSSKLIQYKSLTTLFNCMTSGIVISMRPLIREQALWNIIYCHHLISFCFYLVNKHAQSFSRQDNKTIFFSLNSNIELASFPDWIWDTEI